VLDLPRPKEDWDVFPEFINTTTATATITPSAPQADLVVKMQD